MKTNSYTESQAMDLIIEDLKKTAETDASVKLFIPNSTNSEDADILLKKDNSTIVIEFLGKRFGDRLPMGVIPYMKRFYEYQKKQDHHNVFFVSLSEVPDEINNVFDNEELYVIHFEDPKSTVDEIIGRLNKLHNSDVK